MTNKAFKINPNIKLAVLTNMYKTYFELNNNEKSWEITLFETENEARKWVNP